MDYTNPFLELKFLHQQRIMNVELLLLQLEDTAVHQLYLAEIFFSPPMVCKNGGQNSDQFEQKPEHYISKVMWRLENML
jgi:hypothetical protein